MKHRALLLASSFALLAGGCGHAALTASAPPSTKGDRPASDSIVASARHAVVASAKDVSEEEAPMSRDVGDFVVYKFSGAFRGASSTLTERIVARDGNLFSIDYTLAEASKSQTLRVRLNYGQGARVDILDVASIDDKGAEQPARVEDYDAMMGKTVLMVDDNEGVTGSEKLAVDVNGHSLSCEKTSYRVVLGKHEATMSVTQGTGFAWGDVEDEITGADGTLYYRAELVEMGFGGGSKAKIVASDED